MTPRRFWEATNVDGVLEALGVWFDDGDDIEELSTLESDAFADCGRVRYRLRVRNPDGLYVVEQQAYVETAEGRITWLRVMCAGYRPIEPG